MSLEQAFKSAVARVTDERGKPAVLGKSDGTLYWTDPSGMTHRTRVWARIGEQNSNQAVVVDCLKASPQVDLPVRVDYVNGVLTVIGVDDRRAIEFGGGRPGTPVGAHAWLHSRLGPDPLFISGLQYLPLLVTPRNPADLTVTVQGGAYMLDDGSLQFLETAVSGSLSAYVPGSGYHFVIVCLDRPNDAIVIVDGADVSNSSDALFGKATVSKAEIEAVSISADYWPLAVVLLYEGQTQIKARDITHDLRAGNSGGGGGSPGGSDTQIQYNNGGAFGGASGFTWNDSTNTIGHTKSTATTLETFLSLSQTGAGGAYINIAAGAASGRLGMRSTYMDISSSSPVNVTGSTVNLAASTDITFDPGGYAAIKFKGGGTPEAVFNENADSGYAFRVETANNDHMVYVDPANDAFQIGTTTAGDIADFRSSAIVINNGEADRDLRIAGSGLTVGLYWDAGNGRLGYKTNTPQDDFELIGGATTGFRIRNASSGTTSYFSFVDASSTRAAVQKYSNSGSCLIDIDPIVTDGISSSSFRFFRSVNTSGAVSFDVYKGNNTSTRNASIAGSGDTFLAANNGNVALFGTGSFGSGSQVLFIANRTTAPTTNPTGGGILYVESGALKYRGSSGTVTTIATA